QWPFGNPGANFAVNPINRNEMVIAAPGGGGIAPGRIFRTLDQGLNWFEIRQPSGSFTAALAFGSPVDATTTITGDHILFGNEAGALFVTYNGGATWTQINNGALAGNTSPVRVIAPNPAPGSREAYAVTGNAVYHIDDT